MSYQTQTSPSTTSFTVTFPILSLTDIKAVGKNTGAADWSELAVTNPTSISGVTTCTVTEAPNYDSVRIYRSTGNTALVDFQNGSRLSERDLDTAYNHSLFAAQEVTENAGENITAKGDTGAAGADGADAVITTGSIANDKLENSSVTINGSAVALGGSTTIATGGTNTPSFSAYRTANQSIASDSHTKLEMNIEAYDTNSAYDNSSNYRFTVPSGQGGKYAIGAYCKNNNLTASTKVLSIYKNGSAIFSGQDGNNTAYATLQASTIAVLDAGDYLELYGFQTAGSSQVFVTGGLNTSGFFAYKLIGV